MKFFIGLVIGVVVGMAITLVVQAMLVTPPLPANVFGRFIGSLKPTWLDDGRKMRLNSDFTFVDPNSRAWIAPVGSVIDGASIPRGLWSIVGGPFEGRYRKASVVHDVACNEQTQPATEVHRMFYFACRCAGVEEYKAKVMYFAVLNFGPQWKLVSESKVLDGYPITVNRAVDVAEGRPLSEQDAKAILAYFKTHKPSLAEIEKLKIADGKVQAE